MSARFLTALQASLALGMDCSGTETWRDAVAGRNLTGQTHVITGGDSGLGYFTALALASANAEVVMACRDSAKPTGKCQSAVTNITRITGNQRVSALPCDLSSFASVRAFAAALKGRVSRIDVLINNAGIIWNNPHIPALTEDGFDSLFQVNLLGHHLLVQELLPSLRGSKGRVLHVASSASYLPCVWGNYSSSHGETCTALERLPEAAVREFNWSSALLPNGTLDDSKVDKNSLGVPLSNYGLTKYLMVFHAAELAKREKENGVSAFSLHPGIVDTDMAEQFDPRIMEKVCMGQMPCPRTSEMGASTQTYLAAAPLEEIVMHNGGFYDSCKKNQSVMDIYALEHPSGLAKYQAGLYDMCVKMTGAGVITV
jgi:NAD(P)-dependent dehydrogenase (short-subunit alcohol dehydrogenase family)